MSLVDKVVSGEKSLVPDCNSLAIARVIRKLQKSVQLYETLCFAVNQIEPKGKLGTNSICEVKSRHAVKLFIH